MNRYFLIFLLITSMMLAACQNRAHFWGTPVDDEERWEAEEEIVRIEVAIDELMNSPEEPVTNLAADPRLACGTGGCVMCDDSPRKDECTQKLGNTPGGLINLSDNPGEGTNQIKPLTEYLQIDATTCYYCIYPDGSLECFLDNGKNIKDLRTE